VFKTDVSVYGPVIAELLREERVAPLGPGTPNAAARSLLQGLSVERAFAHARVSDRQMAECCLAGLWLYHDYIDESHKISQDIDTPSGSYWHGILHRREPDPSNAAYWFRRVGRHPVFAPLAEAAQALAGSEVKVPSPWDAFWFIDFCEARRTGKEPGEKIARDIQMQEWELLFDYCYREATR
jgi:hypothetical protein